MIILAITMIETLRHPTPPFLQQSPAGRLVYLLAEFSVPLYFLLTGLVMIAFAQLLYCIRHLAQNSFHLRNRFV